MYWEKFNEQSIFTYIPALESMMGVYNLLQGEKSHQLCTKFYKTEKISRWKEKYRFLFEIYHTIEKISPMGMIEQLLDFPLYDFSMSTFQNTIIEMSASDFLFKYLSWSGNIEELQQATTDDEALNRAYQKVADYCPSFLGFSALIRQSKRYIYEFFSLNDEMQSIELDEAISSVFGKIQLMQESIASEVKEIGSFECSQLRMGKTFHNRGPYDEFYFIPSLMIPGKRMRFFHIAGKSKRQILFLSLRDMERWKKDILYSLKALADSTRYRILILLAQGTPMRGSDIANQLSLAPSTVSHHMEQLKEGGLITEEPVKNAKYYGICKPNVEALLRELERDFKI